MFVGGSCGSALSGALRYLHSPAGQAIASDPNANVVIILPDGVRNYMSKPWFLEDAASEEGEELRGTIRKLIGRDLGDVKSVVKEATANGKTLEKGEGVEKVENGVNGLHIGQHS
jgi:cystathionine beta-synthase